jgi:hypothetical protein
MAVRQRYLEEILSKFICFCRCPWSFASRCCLEVLCSLSMKALDSQLQRHLRCNDRLCISCNAIFAAMADWA